MSRSPLVEVLPPKPSRASFKKFVARELRNRPFRSLLITVTSEPVDDLWDLCEGDAFDYYLQEEQGDDGLFYYYGVYVGQREQVIATLHAFDADIEEAR